MAKKTIIGYQASKREIVDSVSLLEIQVPGIENKRILMGVPASTAGDRETREGEKKEPINNAELLAIHEHGTFDGRIPARPLLEPVLKQEQEFINENFAEYINLIQDQKFDEADVHLERMAIYLEGRLVSYFDNNTWTPNAPSTIKRKGSAKPLIDTGDLRRSIRAFVDEKKEVVLNDNI